MGLLKFLFITIAVMYLIKMVARLLLPVLFQNVVNKAQNQANNQKYQNQKRTDGQISVDYIPPREKETKLDKAGDFVDYEEIKP